eukprot:1156499-Pelagomonas_calceolata.AAC.6
MPCHMCYSKCLYTQYVYPAVNSTRPRVHLCHKRTPDHHHHHHHHHPFTHSHLVESTPQWRVNKAKGAYVPQADTRSPPQPPPYHTQPPSGEYTQWRVDKAKGAYVP